MNQSLFPVIDLAATGENIIRLRERKGLSVRDLQDYFGFEAPQAIYKWQSGKSLPTVDNLFALSVLLETPMNEIIVRVQPARIIRPQGPVHTGKQQAEACCSVFFGRCICRGV